MRSGVRSGLVATRGSSDVAESGCALCMCYARVFYYLTVKRENMFVAHLLSEDKTRPGKIAQRPLREVGHEKRFTKEDKEVQ